MIYLTLVILSTALCALFLFTVALEARTGKRFFRETRERLDREAARIFFIVAHVDLAAFLRDLVREAGKRIAHDIAHLSLIIVRATERLLTRVVRALRAHTAHTNATTPAPTSPFVRSMKDLKHKLRNGSDANAPVDE